VVAPEVLVYHSKLLLLLLLSPPPLLLLLLHHGTVKPAAASWRCWEDVVDATAMGPAGKLDVVLHNP
jgi:hypothetical protein